jgi:two-component system NarL family sensor kinase
MAEENPSRQELLTEISDLRRRLEEAEDTLRAIRCGEIDALVISTPVGEKIYTLQGADQSYRILVETINEGAATLGPNGDILYANAKLAEILARPLEHIIGSPFQDYVAPFDRQLFEFFLQEAKRGNSRGETRLIAKGALVAVILSLSKVPIEDTPGAVGMVVTDLSEKRRQEKRVRYLTEQYTQARIKERRRLARELRNGLGEALFKVKESMMTLENSLEPGQVSLIMEVREIFSTVNTAIEDVARVYQELKPENLEDAGLSLVLNNLFHQFSEDTGVKITVHKYDIKDVFPLESQIVIHRIFHETLQNIRKHPGVTEVEVVIRKHPDSVEFILEDDGQGFDQAEPGSRSRSGRELELAVVNDWARILGGELQVSSKKGGGSRIAFTIPFSPR